MVCCSMGGARRRYAGMWMGLDGSIKILKPSDRSFLIVTDGLKVISLWGCFLARAFFSNRLCVKVRSSFFGVVFGLYLGRRLFSMFSAMVAHLCGFLQPFCRSSQHSLHLHEARGRWAFRFISQLVMSLKCLTVLMLWVFCRHVSLFLWYVFGGAPMCCQAGS